MGVTQKRVGLMQMWEGVTKMWDGLTNIWGSYIPDYNNLFRKKVEEQAYVSRIICSNMGERKAFLKEAMSLALVS